jgi:hypothetical protein
MDDEIKDLQDQIIHSSWHKEIITHLSLYHSSEPVSLLTFVSQNCRCLPSPIFVYFCLQNIKLI